ncbi:Os02g0524050 [Oryza sativa Japonica Group]|uniref:Os02g0524050 protein n=1 Tax=Oryza sativa subsp. japonica TaxID=39947 RepID=A0A0P0VJR0_ORYSJ|nr:Os02g0524050 [Oryza sativa Japonica Group]
MNAVTGNDWILYASRNRSDRHDQKLAGSQTAERKQTQLISRMQTTHPEWTNPAAAGPQVFDGQRRGCRAQQFRGGAMASGKMDTPQQRLHLPKSKDYCQGKNQSISKD